MSLAFDRYPGEWHGNKSISLVFSHLNKLYSPLPDFKVCLFGNETVYLDKVLKYSRQGQRDWMQRQWKKDLS
jgi:hypothetical protein